MTPKTTERFVVDGPAGALEIVVNAPPQTPRGIALVAHPHPQQGGTLDNKVAQTLAKTFFGLGYAAVRFNFRGVGQSEGAFDDGAGETDDALAALAHAKAPLRRAPRRARRIFVRLVRADPRRGDDRRRTPGAGRARGDVASANAAVAEDTIVIHGEEDDVVPLADVLAWARPRELPVIVFPGCGHFFHGRLPELTRTIAGMWHGATTVVPGA